MKITKEDLRQTDPENVRRLARFLKMKHIDEMSDGQLIRLLHWYFTRREKREKGMSGGWSW